MIYGTRGTAAESAVKAVRRMGLAHSRGEALQTLFRPEMRKLRNEIYLQRLQQMRQVRRGKIGAI